MEQCLLRQPDPALDSRHGLQTILVTLDRTWYQQNWYTYKTTEHTQAFFYIQNIVL